MRIKLVRRDSLLIIPIYIFLILIPTYYSSTTVIPAPNAVNVTHGILDLKSAGKSGYVISIESKSGKDYFTCRSGLLGDYQSCPIPGYGRELVGKEVTLSWFEQPIYIFVTQKRVLSISSDGREVLPSSAVIEDIIQRKNRDPYFAILVFVIFVGIAVFFEHFALKRMSSDE